VATPQRIQRHCLEKIGGGNENVTIDAQPNKKAATSRYTLKPSSRKQALWASIWNKQPSGPFNTKHSSRALRVFGQEQQIFLPDLPSLGPAPAFGAALAAAGVARAGAENGVESIVTDKRDLHVRTRTAAGQQTT